MNANQLALITTREVVVHEPEAKTLIPEQAEITFGWNADGGCILTQKNWPNDDSIIVIGEQYIQIFLDKICDEFGIPSVG